MKRKKIIADIKIKLTDLKKEDTFKYQSLNQYAEYINNAKRKLNLAHFEEVLLLNSGESNYSKTPTNSESAKRTELINKYGEALTEINPNLGNNILQQFKESSSIFKLVNIGVIISAGILFFGIGKSMNNNNSSTSNIENTKINDSLNTLLITKDKEIKNLFNKIDSITKSPLIVDISYLSPKSIFQGNVFISSNESRYNKSILNFKGIQGVSLNPDNEFKSYEIEIEKGDRFYFKYNNEIWTVNVLDLILGVEIEIIKTLPNKGNRCARVKKTIKKVNLSGF